MAAGSGAPARRGAPAPSSVRRSALNAKVSAERAMRSFLRRSMTLSRPTDERCDDDEVIPSSSSSFSIRAIHLRLRDTKATDKRGVASQVDFISVSNQLHVPALPARTISFTPSSIVRLLRLDIR